MVVRRTREGEAGNVENKEGPGLWASFQAWVLDKKEMDRIGAVA